MGAILLGDTELEETFENLILNDLDLLFFGQELFEQDIEDFSDCLSVPPSVPLFFPLSLSVSPSVLFVFLSVPLCFSFCPYLFLSVFFVFLFLLVSLCLRVSLPVFLSLPVSSSAPPPLHFFSLFLPPSLSHFFIFSSFIHFST